MTSRDYTSSPPAIPAAGEKTPSSLNTLNEERGFHGGGEASPRMNHTGGRRMILFGGVRWMPLNGLMDS